MTLLMPFLPIKTQHISSFMALNLQEEKQSEKQIFHAKIQDKKESHIFSDLSVSKN